MTMKKSMYLLFALFFVFGFLKSVYGQADGVCEVPDVKKGRLMTADGLSLKFKKLTCRNDTVFFTTKTGVPQKMGLNNIFKVEKTSNYALSLGIAMGAGALAGGIWGALSYDGSLEGSGGLIAGLTVGFTAFGALLGLALKKHKEVYRNPDYSFDFKVEPLVLHNNARVYSIGFRVHL
jgi:hypothetical protein